MPGAKDQHLHKDHRALFTKDAEDEPINIPPVAITTMIPLVPLDEQIGTTQVIKSSHTVSSSASELLPCQTPIVPLGGCFLMDLALSHKGQGNNTDRIRPILNMVYQQRWFVDNKNFHLQPPIKISRATLDSMPKKFRSLLDWVTYPS